VKFPTKKHGFQICKKYQFKETLAQITTKGLVPLQLMDGYLVQHWMGIWCSVGWVFDFLQEKNSIWVCGNKFWDRFLKIIPFQF
jgi:hypothetical protein